MSDLRYLKQQGLVSHDLVNARRDGRSRSIKRIEVITLTPDGEKLARESNSFSPDQKLYHGLVKPRESNRRIAGFGVEQGTAPCLLALCGNLTVAEDVFEGLVCVRRGPTGTFRDSHCVAFLWKVMGGQGCVGVFSTGVSRYKTALRLTSQWRTIQVISKIGRSFLPSGMSNV